MRRNITQAEPRYIYIYRYRESGMEVYTAVTCIYRDGCIWCSEQCVFIEMDAYNAVSNVHLQRWMHILQGTM
jgi:hypothetical protein